MRSRLLSIMGDKGLRQIIKSPTRVTNSSRSTIDLILTNINPSLIMASGTIEVSISDHKTIYLNKKAKRIKHPKKTISSRNYHNYVKDTFGNVLFDNQAWRTYWNTHGDPNKLWDILNQIMSYSVDVLCPRRMVTIREDQHPWVVKKLRHAFENKNKQFKIAQLTNLPEDWDTYHSLKTVARRSIIRSKPKFINGKLQEHRDDPRLFWREMDKNLNIGKGKSASTSCDRIKDKHGEIVTGKVVLETFNDFCLNRP